MTGLTVCTTDDATAGKYRFTYDTIKTGTLYAPVHVEECKGPAAELKKATEG